MARGRRRRAGSSGGAADASQARSGKVKTYDKLLSHFAAIPSRGIEDSAEADDEAGKGVAVASAGAADAEEDAEAEEALNDEAAAGAAADEEEDDAAEEDTDVQWHSDGYDRHYGGEWPTSELESRRASWQDARTELPGLGQTHALLPPGASATAFGGKSAGRIGAGGAEGVLRAHGIIPPMRAAWKAAYGEGPLSNAQRSLLGVLSSHADAHLSSIALDAYEELMPILALHAVQHITLTQKMLQRHKRKGLTPQDQGFTRPTVLVLLPFRAQAHAFMQHALQLLPSCYEQVENKARFFKEYGDDGEPMPASKPEDYQLLFDGNNDDCFRCALRLTRKACKLYSPFYAADLIVGSPLGLRSLIGESDSAKRRKGAAAGGGSQPRDADWLTSIELTLVPYADVLLMQNWSHVHDLFELLNRLPTTQRPDTDFSRVRPWYLEGDAAKLRQTALLAAHPAAELTALMRRGCTNVAGRIATLPSYDGILGHTPAGIKQLFVRFAADDPAKEADARLKAFRERLLPSLLTAMTTSVGNAQTMLFVPRYFDFVRVRQLLAEEDVPFVAVSEYSTPSQIGRARTALQKREVPLLLYTERAHFFRRHKLRGARHLAIYSPPSYAHFCTELIQQLDRANDDAAASATAGDATCVTLFCKLDLYPLQRLVGSERAARMLAGQEASFLFA